MQDLCRAGGKIMENNEEKNGNVTNDSSKVDETSSNQLINSTDSVGANAVLQDSQESLVGEEVDIAINNVFKYLDTIDLSSYLKEFKYKTIRDMMDKLEEDISYDDDYSNTLFDAVAEDEFVNYLNNKYNLRIQEETVSYYYIR
jgi:hypothetical protein